MIKAYASYFTSYLLLNLKKTDNISGIILFGSAARNEATNKSDIDIFIDVRKQTKNFENSVNELLNNFYKSKDALLFRTRGVDNKINLIIGRLDGWKELKKSIESTGIILYGKYLQNVSAGEKKYALLFWNKIGKNRGAFLNKIYGFNTANKRYSGILEKFSGKKIGKSSVLIPIQDKDEIISLFKIYKVDAGIIEVYM